MFAAGKSTLGTPTSIGDPFFNYVTLLLQGDGTNGAKNNTFLDSSVNNFTITRNGNTTQGSFSPYGSNWSNYFNGNSNNPHHLSISGGTNLNLTGDYTIECWYRQRAATNPTGYGLIFATSTGFVGPNEVGFWVDYPNVGFNFGDLSSNTAIVAGTWYHLAATKSGSTTRFFINGVLVASSTSAYTPPSNINWYIGSRPYGSAGGVYCVSGHISNCRIVKGTALYTSTFTPSIVPLTAVSGTQLLTCQSNGFVDNSSNAFAINVTGNTRIQRFSPFKSAAAYGNLIGGSGHFDGTGDYLSTASTPNLAFGSGNFTIEAWVYANDLGSYNAVFAQWPDNGGTVNNSYTLETVGSSMYFYWASSAGLHGPANLGTITAGEWVHYAISRSGNTLYPFKNGVLQTTVSITETLNSPASAVTVGGQVANGGYWNGFISNLRVVKGTAVYTSNFTPPTAPITAIENTQFLVNFTNGAIFDDAMMINLETSGTAGISTSVKKYGTGSISIGSNQSNTDYLTTILNGGLFALSGDFTVEFWLYKITSSQYGPIIETRSSDDTVSGIYLMDYNSTLVLYPFYELAPSIETYTWIHFAAVRSGNTLTIYKNGVSAGSTACATSTYKYDSAARLSIGAVVGFGARYFNGYIDDLRITNGVARYLTNFTPPAAALPVNG